MDGRKAGERDGVNLKDGRGGCLRILLGPHHPIELEVVGERVPVERFTERPPDLRIVWHGPVRRPYYATPRSCPELAKACLVPLFVPSVSRR